MQEKHVKSKETDITGLLVVVFVLMIGILIAKVAGDFTTRSTSTSTRASERTAARSVFATTCSENGKMTWWGKTIPCPVAKVNGKCPKTNPVDDDTSTSLNPTQDLQCHTEAAMDTYFGDENPYEGVKNIETAQVRRGNFYCETMIGNGLKPVCLRAPWDLTYSLFAPGFIGKKGTIYSGYRKYISAPTQLFGVQCPILESNTGNIYVGSGSEPVLTVKTGECYIPVPMPTPTNTP